LGELFGGIWNAIWETQLNILVAIDSVVHVPALAIIIFTVLIRLLTVPLTMKSLRSNRNMQQIQPLIKEIQKKHKDDKAKQQEETMKLYSQYGINPASGCLPMIVQLPVFFALYQALRFTLDPHTTTEMLHAILWNKDWVDVALGFGSSKFLWLTGLGQADPFFIWPIISSAFQFIQNRMAMPRRDPGQIVDAQQRMMQGMMQFMPLFTLLFAWNFPAGNVIYWAFSSIFGAAQQYFITGFGTLPKVPGFGWLPEKEIAKPREIAPLAPGQVRKKGVFGKLMDNALSAQQTRATATEPATTTTVEEPRSTRSLTSGTGSTSNARGARPERARDNRDGATTTRVRSKGSEPNIRIVQSSGTSAPTAKYASDLRAKNDTGAANGITGASLPPRKKNKR
jgi:YidC/Oxa1 family membrane protein insertase